MPASNMGSTSGAGNPSTGKAVIMNPFSGPKGSPFDKDTTGNYSTGALNTGIGYGMSSPVFGPVAPQSIKDAGFDDNYVPGVTMPDGLSLNGIATLTCIGGGRSQATANGIAVTQPYVAQPLLGFGNGGSRDAGSSAPFTGFGLKTVTASAAVAIGAAVEAGFINRASVALVAGQSVFGSNASASPPVA